jgi:hypothetical protein
MRTESRLIRYVPVLGLLFLYTASATLTPSLTFEQLTDASELIVTGRVGNSWAAWDADHKFIWTHYNLSVSSALKGSPAATVEFAEVGGAVDGYSMVIAGSVRYATGDNMLVFLARMPNGYLRTAGWSQGKYALDASGKLHAQSSSGAETIDLQGARAGTSLRVLDGMSLTELRQRVSARLRAAAGRNQ